MSCSPIVEGAIIDDAELFRVCEEAWQYKFLGVHVPPRDVARACNLLRGSGVLPVSAVGFSKRTDTDSMVDDALLALQGGARRLDMVIEYAALVAGDTALVDRRIQDVVRTANRFDATVGAVFDVSLLWRKKPLSWVGLVRQGCRIVQDAGVTCVEVFTDPVVDLDLVVGAVRSMREIVGPYLDVKAFGSIDDSCAARRVLFAGANIIGCSQSVAIVTR